MRSSLLSCLVAFSVALSCGSVLALDVYTARSAFEAAVGPTEDYDFNSESAAIPFHTTPADFGAFTLSMTGSPDTDGRNQVDFPPPLYSEFDIDGTTIVNVLIELNKSLFVTFDRPVRGFGADFASLNDDEIRTRIIVGSEEHIPTIAGGFTVRFIGVVSDTPFTQVEFRGFQNDGFGMDNLIWAQVPEPSAALLIGSIGLVAGMRRRRD